MTSKWSLLALGLGVYLAVAIGSFPAGVAYRWFAPDELRLASIEGTIWNGRAAYGAAGGFPFSDLRWPLHPAALFTGRLSLSAEARLVDGLASANIVASGGRVELTDVRASASLQSLRELLSLGDTSGRLSVSLPRLELVDGAVQGVEGTVTVSELYAAPLIPTEGVTSILLGNFRADLSSPEGSGIVAVLHDEGGPLELAGRATLAPDRSYTLDALLKARPEAHEMLVQGIEIVTGEPNAEGQRKFVQRGTL